MLSSQAPLDLKLYRALLLVGGIVIIGFGPLYQLVEPGIVDPIWVRLGVGLSCLLLVGLTFLSKWFRENALLGIYALFYVVSAWQLSLTYLNNLSVNTTFAMMLVIFGCSVGFRKPTHLAIYSGFVIVATTITAFVVSDPEISRITYLVTLTAIATLGYFVLRSRLEMVDELRRSMNASDVAMKAKSEFLATMSHEIRTPMNGVIGMTTLLSETELTSEQQDYVDTIRVSGESLLTIINDILDFSKIEAEKIELEEQPFELRQCIEEALDLLTSKAAENRLELAYTLEDSVPETIKGDVTRLRQILVNLLGNAVKFTEDGEVVIEVESRLIQGSGSQALHELQFAVRDTGIGIPEDRVSRLFSSFSQIDSSTTRKYGGTGLGLAISRRLAELMGGTMWVESTVGVGSTFYFTVLVNEATISNAESLRGHRPELAGRHVLIVDDNETNRRILQKQSENWGMMPVACAGGAEALEWVDSGGTYDFAILDLQMPEMDGMMLAEALRTRPAVRECPLIMLSSVGNRIRAGGLLDAALTKPVKQTQLFNVLVSVVSIQERIRKMPEDWSAPASLLVPEGFEEDKPSPSHSGWDSLTDQPETEYPVQIPTIVPIGDDLPDSTLDTQIPVEQPQPNAQTEALPPATSPQVVEKAPLRILMAEDNAVNQKVALGILKRLGYAADVVANGLEVLKALELADYDVILMDVQMPEMDGLEATRRIRQTVPREKRPRIIAMTANAMQGDRDRCLEAGMDDYVPKPLRHGELATSLAKCGRIAVSRKPPGQEEGEVPVAPRTTTPVHTQDSILDRTPTKLDFNTLIGPKAVAKPKTLEGSTPAVEVPSKPKEPVVPAANVPIQFVPAEPKSEPPPRQQQPAPPQPSASEPPVTPQQAAVIELDSAARAVPNHLRMLTGVEDLGFAEEVLTSYLQADTLLMEKIRTAHAQGDAESVAKAVHKLKSSSGILGAKSLAKMCAELERHARSGSVGGTGSLCDAMTIEVQRFHVIAERALRLIREEQREPA